MLAAIAAVVLAVMVVGGGNAVRNNPSDVSVGEITTVEQER